MDKEQTQIEDSSTTQNIEHQRGLTEEDIKTKLVGEVSKRVEVEVVATILDVFKEMGFSGTPPREVIISKGSVTLPSGEEIAAIYSFNEGEGPGWLQVSTEKSKSTFPKRCPEYVATAAYAAHEAVEHVNYLRGEKVLVSTRKIPKKARAESKTEQEANRITRKIIKRRYGLNLIFGDEAISSS